MKKQMRRTLTFQNMYYMKWVPISYILVDKNPIYEYFRFAIEQYKQNIQHACVYVYVWNMESTGCMPLKTYYSPGSQVHENCDVNCFTVQNNKKILTKQLHDEKTRKKTWDQIFLKALFHVLEKMPLVFLIS